VLAELWPGIFWFALGSIAMWGFLRILPARLHRSEFNLDPVTFYRVPSVVNTLDTVDDVEASPSPEDTPTGQAHHYHPSNTTYIEDAYEPSLYEGDAETRRAALAERLRLRGE
jgi:hypothetical protein